MAEFNYDQNSLDMADILADFHSHCSRVCDMAGRHGGTHPKTGKVIMEIVTNRPVDPGAMFEKIRKSGAGSVLLHYAVVKSQTGDRVSAGIHFEKAGDIEGELHPPFRQTSNNAGISRMCCWSGGLAYWMSATSYP